MNIVGVDFVGTAGLLMSYTGNIFGLSGKFAAAPHVTLLEGVIDIDMSSLTEATSSTYINVVSQKDFTVAFKTTCKYNMGDFVGRWMLSRLRVWWPSRVICTLIGALKPPPQTKSSPPCRAWSRKR